MNFKMRAFSIVLLGTLLPVVSRVKADDVRAMEQQRVQVASGAAELDLTSFVRESNLPLVFADITPGPRNNGILVGSFGIDGDTGKSIKIPGGVDSVLIEGHYHILSVLSGENLPAEHDYQWKCVYKFSMSLMSAQSTNPIFIYKDFRGPCLFRYAGDRPADPTKMLPIVRVPAEWKDFVKAAWDVVRADASTFDPGQVATNKQTLLKFMDGDNPIISVMAERALLAGHIFDERIASASLSSRELRQSALTLNILLSSTAPDQTLIDNLAHAIVETDKAEDVQGMAIAALAALRSKQPQAEKFGFHLLQLFNTREAAVHNPSLADKNINDILRCADLGLLSQSPIFNPQAIHAGPAPSK